MFSALFDHLAPVLSIYEIDLVWKTWSNTFVAAENAG